MQKFGFFGGCFNPPSKIHIKIANKVLEENKLDKLIFVPMGDFFNKEELIASKHRYNMLKLAVQKCEKLEVDDIELNVNKNVGALEAFKLIEKKYGQNIDFYFIMGSDNYEKMPTWANYNELIKYKYIVIPRTNDKINSTIIRKMITNGQDVSQHLDINVIDYIYENKLYL